MAALIRGAAHLLRRRRFGVATRLRRRGRGIALFAQRLPGKEVVDRFAGHRSDMTRDQLAVRVDEERRRQPLERLERRIGLSPARTTR